MKESVLPCSPPKSRMWPWTRGGLGHLQHFLTLQPRSKARATPEKHSSESTWSNGPADGLAAASGHQTKGMAHFSQSSGQAQPSSCGFHRQCLVCVWKPGCVRVVTVVCVSRCYLKRKYTHRLGALVAIPSSLQRVISYKDTSSATQVLLGKPTSSRERTCP